eukprot:TRINITY_DN87386_c0_g1_i1.p1 TRINITY_DN87386_c0_g1~~TRINITY_DN87386_c0_g1_i1.p1  ORF type:complete len:126 (-),score=28.90 TRINITY_DN87386_c0_g1_i1:252-629(-)
MQRFYWVASADGHSSNLAINRSQGSAVYNAAKKTETIISEEDGSKGHKVWDNEYIGTFEETQEAIILTATRHKTTFREKLKAAAPETQEEQTQDVKQEFVFTKEGSSSNEDKQLKLNDTVFVSPI